MSSVYIFTFIHGYGKLLLCIKEVNFHAFLKVLTYLHTVVFCGFVVRTYIRKYVVVAAVVVVILVCI